MPRASIERRIPWPRDRTWRPGEPITLIDEAGATITYRLRGVMRDTDPGSAFALVSLEPLRTIGPTPAPRRKSRIGCRPLADGSGAGRAKRA